MAAIITSSDKEPLDWRDFLTDRPPGTRASVDRAAARQAPNQHQVLLVVPELQLHCDGKCQCVAFCKGNTQAIGRLFGGCQGAAIGQYGPPAGAGNLPYDALLNYSCEKCYRVVKSYALRFWSVAVSPNEVEFVDVQKLAEWPPFSPRTPGKVTSLIGPDRDLYPKGRRAEMEGLGVGAFSYYRRIIEGQKNRFLDEIIRVARHLNAPVDTITTLETAKGETQFSKAVASVKDAIPPTLYIKGRNPFTLLHGALSEGLHDATDDECLVAASDIRLILVEFAERLTEAMKEQKELDEALTRLMNRKK